MRRRDFLERGAAAAVALGLQGLCPDARGEREPKESAASWSRLPRWRGFNLLEKFKAERQRPFVERDFEWMAKWKLDFVRLPLDYRSWSDPAKPDRRDEKALGDIDQVVEWGKEYRVHVNLNLHRAPGYCVNPPAEPLDLWTSEEAQRQFCREWRHFAERFKDVPPERVSFDLLNEPKDMNEARYAGVMQQAIDAIRAVDPNRLIVVDGLKWGRNPVLSLVKARVAQSTRGYDPMQISHYQASWVNGSRWKKPTWPLKTGSGTWDRERYRKERIAPWKELEARGGAVHVGEWGCYNRTPHDVAIAWMRDLLGLWRQAGWGWALWNLRGSFGIVDSRRRDVDYEDFSGHKLDRRMLELLLEDGQPA